MILKYVILISILSFTHCGLSQDVQYGGCQPENQTCAECYYKLKMSLLKSDVNIRNLSTTFYPPTSDSPEFVTVTYCFNENCSTYTTWYWSLESSYLFLPLETFEFLSLYFSKPMQYITQNVKLYLDEECKHADNKWFNLLTQRVRVRKLKVATFEL